MGNGKYEYALLIRFEIIIGPQKIPQPGSGSQEGSVGVYYCRMTNCPGTHDPKALCPISRHRHRCIHDRYIRLRDT